ncbi:MAG: phage terminase large subunit family protein [Gemmatimonadota bacterium]|nr:MAG: phage terminase large subunit family protein [Gemmatimonadota bacterium]
MVGPLRHAPTKDGADAEYYAQLTSERVVIERVGGRWVRRYKQTRERNEALDCEVLALAALHSLGPAVVEHLDHWHQQVLEAGDAARAGQVEQPAEPARPRVAWVDRWREGV